jgi:hypothetical protein
MSETISKRRDNPTPGAEAESTDCFRSSVFLFRLRTFASSLFSPVS